jgi:hypothetical protein
MFFELVAQPMGIDFVHTNGANGDYIISETVVGGIASADLDLDRRIDLILLNSPRLPGSQPDAAPRLESMSQVYRNLGEWRFSKATVPSGLITPEYAMGIAVADYDLDGFPDIYVSNHGPNRMFRNQGDGTFVDVTAQAGVGIGMHVGAGISFLDIEGDGDLDLYVASYVVLGSRPVPAKSIGNERFHPGPADFPPGSPWLFENLGDGRFQDRTHQSGLSGSPGYGMATVAADWDEDGDVDIFVCNDGTANFYWANDGKGHFTDQALMAGLAFDGQGKANSNMGVDVGDFDGDGRLDLFTTCYQSEMPVMYRNLGDGLFEDATAASKIDRRLFPHVHWGTAFADFDLDQDLDLYVACGHFMENVSAIDDRTQYRVRDFLLSNGPLGTYRDVADRAGSGMNVVESSRGITVDDLDNDGDQDVVVIQLNSRPSFLRNDRSNGYGWAQFQLVGTQSNRDAVGAKVQLRSLRGHKQVASIVAGRGYQSHFGQRLTFGIGMQDRMEMVEVRWPLGNVELFDATDGNGLQLLVEGTGKPRSAR